LRVTSFAHITVTGNFYGEQPELRVIPVGGDEYKFFAQHHPSAICTRAGGYQRINPLHHIYMIEDEDGFYHPIEGFVFIQDTANNHHSYMMYKATAVRSLPAFMRVPEVKTITPFPESFRNHMGKRNRGHNI
jgi:hypothetical protein